MPSYFLTTRTIRRPRNRPAYFADEVDTPSYVISPDSATTLDPEDRVMGANKARNWATTILEEAKRVGDPGDIVFIVHGYNTDAQDAFNAHQDVVGNLRAQGLKDAVFVSYSWPSKGSFLNYLEDDSDARASAMDLVKSGLALFAILSEPDCRVKVHVMAHSMGTLVVREALRAAPGSKDTRDAAWGITQLIFYAADISARSLVESDGVALFTRSQRFTNYFNRHDKVLATSNAKRFLSSPRLGRHGAPDARLDHLVDVDVSDHWKVVADTNTAGTIGDVSLSHSFYRVDPVFARDVVHTIRGDIDRREIPTRAPSHEPGRLKLVAP